MIRNICLLLFCIFLTGLTSRELETYNSLRTQPDADAEVLYLPSGEGLQVLSFGFKNFLSDVLWFKTISYFGKHYRTDRNYKWLAHMCKLVTELDPRAEHAYDFCGTMLAWEANLPEESVNLYTNSIKANPERWRPYYLRGFTYMYFLEQPDLAKEDFLTGSQKPSAPAFLSRLAAKKISLSDPIAALSFLSEAIQRATDPTEKNVLKQKFKEIQKTLIKEAK